MEGSRTIGKVGGTTISADTVAGAAYVNKVTHPPTSMTSEYLGRPDCSAPNVVLMELKSEANFAPIITLPTSATATKTINPSSLLFLQASGAYVSNYCFMYVADPSVTVSGWVQPQSQASSANQPAITQPALGVSNNAGYVFTNFNNDVSTFRTTYKSSTYYLNATNFNNQGTVTSAKFKPNITGGANLALYLKELKDTDPNEFKSFYGALMLMMKGDDTISRATSKPIQTSDRRQKQRDPDFDIIDELDDFSYFNGAPYQIATMGSLSATSSLPFSNVMDYTKDIPTNASELMVMSPKAATRPATQGAFVVLQQLDETMPWTSAPSNSGTAAVPSGLVLSFIKFASGSSTAFYPLYSTAIANNTVSAYTADTPWNGLDWSFTLFEGLTVPSTVGTTLTSVPYITVKSFVGLEVQPNPKSSLSCFQKTLPLPDYSAIRMATGIMHARPDSLPASANDLASIAATAIKFLPTAVTWLKELFSSKPEQKQQKTIVTRKPARAAIVAPQRPQRARRNAVTRTVPVANQKAVTVFRKPAVATVARMAKLEQAVERMAVTVNKSAAPATRLPKYVSDNTAVKNANPKPRRATQQFYVAPRGARV